MEDLIYCPVCYWAGEKKAAVLHYSWACIRHCPQCWPLQAHNICDADRIGTKASLWYGADAFEAALV